MKEIVTRGRPRLFDREEALDKAMELFWERGFETTSLSDLTTALGIAPASFYAAFGNKEQLFLETVKRYDTKFGALDEHTLDGVRSVKELVRRALTSAAEAFTVRGKPHGCMVISSATNCSSEVVEGAMRRQRIRNEKALEKKLLELNATRPKATAKFVATMIQGMSIQARDGATRVHLLEMIDAAL